MIISSIDASITSSGITKFYLNDKLEITNKKYLGFTTVKKNVKKNDEGEIIYYNLGSKTKPSQFKNDIERFMWFEEKIINFVQDSNYIGLEGYAFAAKGKVFNIGEFTGNLKKTIYLKGIPLRIYDPNTIKMFATNNGNCDKSLMLTYFLKEPEHLRFEFPKDLIEKAPYEDIIDSYWVNRLLLQELRLRKGFDLLHEMKHEKKIEAFNRITKAHPVNILSQDFIVVNI